MRNLIVSYHTNQYRDASTIADDHIPVEGRGTAFRSALRLMQQHAASLFHVRPDPAVPTVKAVLGFSISMRRVEAGAVGAVC